MALTLGLDVGNAIGGLAGFAGLLGANASTRKQYKYQSRLQEQAAKLNYKYGLKSLENSPTSQRSGLEKAGYNPMLAVQNATSGANAGWTSSGQMSAPDYSQVVSNALDAKRVANESAQTDSTVKLQEAQGRNATAEAISKEIHNQYLPEREQKELGQIGAATDKLIRETSFMDQLAENMEAERRLQELGIYVNAGNVRYQADKAYNASKYASDIEAETKRGTISTHNPFGLGGTTRYYQPDDIIRMQHRGYRSFKDWDNNEYWHYY